LKIKRKFNSKITGLGAANMDAQLTSEQAVAVSIRELTLGLVRPKELLRIFLCLKLCVDTSSKVGRIGKPGIDKG